MQDEVRVRNWPEYDRALAKRGNITVWFAEDAVGIWTPPKTGRRGGYLAGTHLPL